MSKVIPKNLWIDQVIHALTVTKEWVVHALTVTIPRINGHRTIYSLYLPIVKTPVVGASLFGDNLAGCHPNRLHLPPTAVLKNAIKTMKKTPVSLLMLLCALFFTSGAIAQNKPLACQGEAGAGVNWRNGQWVTTKFETTKFVLVQAGNLLTRESVAKAFQSTDINSANCSFSDGAITCYLSLGRVLYFNPVSLRGATSALFGSTLTGTIRDSVAVEVFSCTPF